MPVRVLLLHNRYRLEGGEERAVQATAELLRSRGHEVQVLERDSAQVRRTRAARGMLAGGIEPEAVAGAVRAFGAEIVHAHNLQPLLGARALAAARAAGAATVLHLHNYRMFCAVAVAYRDGRRCDECRGRATLPGVVHRCRGSLAESVIYAAGLARQQPALLRHSDALVAVSDAQAAQLRAFGLSDRRLSVLPNYVPWSAFAVRSEADRGRYALAAGRLVPEKGFDTAIQAALSVGVPLIVAGDGPDEGRLRALAAGADVTFTGRVDARRMAELRREAAVVLMPSRWDEPLPYVALEALAAGVPMLVANRGGLPEVTGFVGAIDADRPEAWTAALQELWTDRALRRRRGESGLARARKQFSEELHYERLTAIYARAMREG